MIYTIGHIKNYLRAVALSYDGQIIKLAGGYAFESPSIARQAIKKLGKLDEWGIWSMVGVWEDDVEHWDENYSIINKDLPIIRLVSY